MLFHIKSAISHYNRRHSDTKHRVTVTQRAEAVHRLAYLLINKAAIIGLGIARTTLFSLLGPVR